MWVNISSLSVLPTLFECKLIDIIVTIVVLVNLVYSYSSPL